MKILVVDDSSTMRSRIRKELLANGHEVVEAANGTDAIKSIPELKPQLMTLDVDMPGIDGFETCHKIRNGSVPEPYAELPIIFITANDTLKSRQKGYQAGGNEFMSKPFLPGELSIAIERAQKNHDGIRGRTVLVVDDSSSVRSLLSIGLKAKGLNIVSACNGNEALETLKQNADKIDLVITDYLMPEMDGDELCNKIRNELGHRELPIIFLSSLGEKEQIIKMFRAGASDFIVKPFSLDEVQARAAVHLNSKILGDQLRSNVSELKRAHTMKDKFLSICSHDLRAPLAGIQGFADLMLFDDDLSEENLDNVRHIKSSAEFLNSIIGDLLELGRVQSDCSSLELKPILLFPQIQSCISNLQHMASPKRIELELEAGSTRDKAQPIAGEKNALKRIFNNLISNSIKFSHPDSIVRIKMERDAQKKRLNVSVIDDGIGIPADKVDGLFDPATKTSQVGTSGEQSFGLGMVIVKQLIDQHRAEVAVTSEKNVGTTITVSFPTDGY